MFNIRYNLPIKMYDHTKNSIISQIITIKWNKMHEKINYY